MPACARNLLEFGDVHLQGGHKEQREGSLRPSNFHWLPKRSQIKLTKLKLLPWKHSFQTNPSPILPIMPALDPSMKTREQSETDTPRLVGATGLEPQEDAGKLWLHSTIHTTIVKAHGPRLTHGLNSCLLYIQSSLSAMAFHFIYVLFMPRP